MAEIALKWTSAAGNIQGRGWINSFTPFSRFPASAKSIVPDDVWTLGLQSTGLFTCFETDSSCIHVAWELGSDKLCHPHMPSTSSSGLDLYRQDVDNVWKWLGLVYPDNPGVNSKIISYGIKPGRAKYMLYLPLLNIIKSLSIGVESRAYFEFGAASTKKPITYYGTSIVHGIAASRAGNCHTAILSRRLNTNIINLGFSGRGKMESSLAELISGIDTQLYIIDCLPNMDASLIVERAKTFLDILFEKKPDTPVLLVEDRTYANSWAIPFFKERNESNRRALSQIYLAVKQGNKYPIHYLKGENLLGDTTEASVDGSHPNDLGFVRLADSMESVIKAIIN